jgi:hypothetical protein
VDGRCASQWESYVPLLEQQSVYPVSVEELFAWHTRPGALQRLTPPWEEVQLLSATGGIQVGAKLELAMRVGPVPVRWQALHDRYEENRWFRDIQLRGPFARWEHEHRFAAAPGGASLTDHVEYELPFPPFGRWLGGRFARATLERTFRYRHELLGYDLRRHAQFHAQGVRQVVIRGAPAPIEAALSAFLTTGGHQLARSPCGADVVVQFIHSRGASEVLRWVQSLSRASRPPEVMVVVEGPEGGGETDRSEAPERAAVLAAAAGAGIRTVLLRTGYVLTPAGEPLRSLLRPSLAGRRNLPVGPVDLRWISIEDLLGLIQFTALCPSFSGSIDAAAPERVSAAGFHAALCRVAKHFRQSALCAPADAPACSPVRAVPGFRFLFPELEGALRFLLGR